MLPVEPGFVPVRSVRSGSVDCEKDKRESSVFVIRSPRKEERGSDYVAGGRDSRDVAMYASETNARARGSGG